MLRCVPNSDVYLDNSFAKTAIHSAVIDDATDPFPPEIVLALVHTPVSVRERLRTAFALDRRLAKIVAGTTEPMLGQMRLAWWRDMLGAESAERPLGDQVLDTISMHWRDDAECLMELVNAWEQMLGAPPLSQDAIQEFGRGRGGIFVASLNSAGDHLQHGEAFRAGQRWALTDAALNIGNDQERGAFKRVAKGVPATGTLRAPYKGLAILNALAMRSLDKGHQSLMQGRGAALTAWKAAIAGR